MRKFRWLLALLLISGTALASADIVQWQPYTNARFGAAADVPVGWVKGAEPDNGDGLQFTAPDGKAMMTIWGNYEMPDDVIMRVITKPHQGETITYQVKKKTSVVLSGLKDERIFYRKHLLTCGNSVWINVSIEYPAAMKTFYDPIVRHVAGSLHQAADCKTL